MSIEWWIIAFLLNWIGGLVLVICYAADRGLAGKRDAAGWLLLSPILIEIAMWGVGEFLIEIAFEEVRPRPSHGKGRSMSTQWLPNVTRILSAARTYKRACGKVRTAKRQGLDYVGTVKNPATYYARVKEAEQECDRAAAALLWLIDTGAKSTNKMPKVKS